MFKPGDQVRVNDKWWAKGARPGRYTILRDDNRREFVVHRRIFADEVQLEKCSVFYFEECFELIGGPW